MRVCGQSRSFELLDHYVIGGPTSLVKLRARSAPARTHTLNPHAHGVSARGQSREDPSDTRLDGDAMPFRL